jgi:hypothetical protein
MNRFLFVLMTFLSLTARGQDSISRSLILDAINFRRHDPVIYYADSSITFFKKLSRYAKHRRIDGFVDPAKGIKGSIILSKADLRQADKQNHFQSSKQWPELFFPNSVRLSIDSLSSFMNYQMSDDFQKNRKYKWYYFFSQPVFLKNGTIAIFRLVELIRQVAGNDLIFVYVKDRQSWNRKLIVWTGSF